jgi:hypothetical protein
MGKSAPSPPPAPDPKVVGAANDKSALWNASLSNANQYTPLGSQTFELTRGAPTVDHAGYDAAMAAYNQQLAAANAPPVPGAHGHGGGRNNTGKLTAPDIANYTHASTDLPQFTSTTHYSPEVQALLDKTEGNMNSLATTAGGLMGQIQDQASHPIDYSKFNPIPDQGSLDQMQNTAYDAQMARLKPYFDQQNEMQNSQLLNQGLSVGSNAWNNAWHTTDAAQNDARLAALNNSQQYAQGMNSLALQNRDQQISEAYQQQQAPLNQYSALMGNTQVTAPQFANVPSANNPAANTPPGGNALEQQYAQQMNAYNAQVASQNSMKGGLGSLAGSLGSAAITKFSDIRLKTDIKPVGRTRRGIPLYSFRYIWNDEPQVGCMAQEVQKLIPAAVHKMPSGFLAVDYSMVH